MTLCLATLLTHNNSQCLILNEKSHNSHRRSGSGSHNKTWVSDNESSDSNNGLTTGAIIGIIIGSILVAVILILALFFCVRKQKGKEKVTRTSSGSLPHGTTNEEGSWFHIRETSLIFACYQPQDHLKMLCVMLVSLVVWSQFVVGSENLAANHDVMQIVEVLDDRARDKRLVALPEKYHKSQSKIRAIAYVFEDIAKDLLSKVMNKHALYLGIARASKLFKKNGMIVL
ncbi:DEAD-box ATP-dependent RNA helicase [Arachis hypogaea]|nr:DEAD-box ATP-dependent RNA helicase [Arachis hypogaea]